MKNSFAVLLLFILVNSMSFAHEEPAKTLHEKKQKTENKKKYAAAGIKTVTMWKQVAGGAKAKALAMGYGKDGTYLWVEAYKNDSLDLRVEYGYSATGDMISDTDFEPNGTMVEKNVYDYDKQGRVVSGISYDKNNEITGTFTIVHSTDKKKVEFLKYNPDKSADYQLVYTYAADYDKEDYSEAVKYNAEGKIQMKVTRTYNEKGMATEKAVYGEDLNLMFTFKYEYDKKGNLSQITKVKADGTTEWKDIYSNNDYGIATGLKSYDAEGTLKTEVIYSFVYFEKK